MTRRRPRYSGTAIPALSALGLSNRTDGRDLVVAGVKLPLGDFVHPAQQRVFALRMRWHTGNHKPGAKQLHWHIEGGAGISITRHLRGDPARLRQIVLSDEIPDPRDLVLVCLIDACALMGFVLSEQELEAATPRIEQLRKMDLIGQAVTRAASETEAIIKFAATTM